jgi:NAD(P)H-hydrate epimerase
MVVPALAEATYLPYETDTGALTPLAGRDILAAFGGYDVLLIGPGISQAAGTADAVSSVLAGVPDGVRGCVVDADALNALAKRPDWHRQLARPCILTPHPGEMARLLDSTVEQVQGDRLNVAMRAASMWGQAVVLKGAHTVVAAPDGRAAVSPHANPLLATAGTGDVLAGVAAGLLAQGMEAFEAAACAVYVHGRAAEDFGETFGDRGMLAGDLLPAIPRAIRAVREGRPLRRASTDLPDLAGGRGADFLSQLLGQPQ